MTAAVSVDELGSHLVVRAPSRTSLADEAARLPHAVDLGTHGTWALPAIPLVAAALQELLTHNAWVPVRPQAERLLASLARLPDTATAVAHLCEHRPGKEGVVIATTPDPEVQTALSTLPACRHDPRLERWWIPARDEPLRALGALLETLPRVTATPEVRRRLGPVEQPSLSAEAVAGLVHRCRIGIEDGPAGEARLRLCRSCHPSLEAQLRRFGAVTRSFDAWWVTIGGDAGVDLREFLAERPELGVDADVLGQLDEAAAGARAVEEMERLSREAEGPVAVDGVAGTLRPFQGAGVEYALRARRTFLADEPGLGKTVQALATLEAARAWPALVVCPASLRLNWLREAARWIPSRTARALVSDWEPDAADLSVASYDILHRLVEPVTRRPPRAVALDESHFCKNPAARRTRAAMAIAAALDPDAIALLLTGTPVLNRPAELIPQLRLLGHLDAVGGARAVLRAHEEAGQLEVLHRRLRRTGYVRRRKADVLAQLPAKQRVVVPIELDNRAEYAAVQADIAGWVRANAEADARFHESIRDLPPAQREAAVRERGRAAEQRARRAEALVRLQKLGLVAARGKLTAALEWIQAFLDTGEKLVIFCHHHEIADLTRNTFADAALATGQISADERALQIARFQEDPDCRAIVCSLHAAGVGVTLTAASNVAFLELGWTPAVHDQAEDRVHRIGQHASVTAWYLLAADTIDERISDVIERKRRLVSAATDGTLARDDSGLDDLLDWISRTSGAA